MAQTTEDKALVLVKEVLKDRGQYSGVAVVLNREFMVRDEALCRAIEQHEAFRQEVSDAVEAYDNCDSEWESETLWPVLAGFIIPKPKPDPLVKVLEKMGWYNAPNAPEDVENFRAALAAAGLEIREKNDDN